MRALTAQPARSRRLAALAGVAWLALILSAQCASSAAADEPTLKLRIAWGGGAERTWRGTVSVSAGRLADPQPLGLEPDEAGSIWADDAGKVEVRSPSPRSYDGFDIDVHADISAKLTIVLAADGEPLPKPVSIELASLVKAHHMGELDGKNNRLLVRRAPGDTLQVKVLRPDPLGRKKGQPLQEFPSLVFAPNEKLVVDVKPRQMGLEPSAPLFLRAQLQYAPAKQELWSHEQEVKAPADEKFRFPWLVEVQAPAEPGVYDLILTAYPKGQIADRLLPIAGRRELMARLGQRGEPLAERKIQIVVVGDAAPPAAERPGPPDTELMTINPAKTWWERVAHMPRIPGLGKEPLEFGAIGRMEHPQLGPVVVLQRDAGKNGVAPKAGGPAAAGAGETWVAYPLTVSQPGQVHIVEVEYPSDVPQAMTISVVEPNASGAVTPIGLDSGLYVPPEATAQPPRVLTHRLTFWPRTREPLLLISRAVGAERAMHGRIRLLGPKRYSVGLIRLPMDAHSALPPATAIPGESERLVVGLMERPLFPENFGAAESFDSWSGGSLDDWTTYYDGGRRMIEYAQHIGYNALMVAALADGSTIYPSDLLQPTPRYDSGAFFSTGQDPVRKDVLEMLLRLADREHMVLIPLLQFSSPLPELEDIARRGGPQAEGLQLVGSTGAAWVEKHGDRRGQAAYYNPLDPRVQQAIRNVVRELARRYGKHRSFGGVALGSTGPSYALLPGVEWGLDDVTIERFCREKGIQLAGEGPGRFAARAKAVAGPHRQAWLTWRADVLHAFHVQLQQDVAAASPAAKLIVTTGGMLQGADSETALRPALPPRMKADELPLTTGIRPDLYRGDDGIVLLRPRLVSAPDTSRSLAVALPADAPELDNVFRGAASTGNLLLHTPLRSRLASFDQRSPFGANKTYQSLVAHLATAAPHCRRRLVQAAGGLDAPLLVDGGWMLTLGEEEALAPLLVALRRLPVGEYQPVAGETQGISCRWLSRPDGTYLCVLNPTPWPCRATLSVRGHEEGKLTELSGRREAPKLAAGVLTLNLEPYDLLAVKFGEGLGARGEGLGARGQESARRRESRIGFSNFNVDFDPQVREGLHQRLRDLVSRAALLSEPRRWDVLANPNFELAGDGTRELAGWTMVGGEGSQAIPDPEIKHAGQFSARLTSQRGVASLISDPFAPPQTGRLSIAVRLRTTGGGAPPALRLALGGKLDGGDYYRFAEAPVDAAWRYYIFTVDNLPLEGLSDLQVRFDMMGAGQAWIDDVVVSDLALSDNERAELSRIATRAQFAIDDGRLADCLRLLETYWPRYLEDNVPIPHANVAAGAPASPAAEPATSWWKRGLPSVFR